MYNTQMENLTSNHEALYHALYMYMEVKKTITSF